MRTTNNILLVLRLSFPQVYNIIKLTSFSAWEFKTQYKITQTINDQKYIDN